ncbi:DUF4159 domain-containing protein [Jannaschia seohaensis]|uniref:N-terminal double-transmembrane domain-containing protein n=1 Tax=Jannaschia seohaensis TaxID=475081 RepID=A0A2Y9A238_9RHOB|nr:DUF4159 domain-containing protein [Jannaschia seohaensis]PWJ22242.1 putative membrane protein (TIGR02226 family) [Jannaschia seohaensis]SSA38520.1 N-terminal double-transmembrane domain-containing protein [Jannaschia seohaensis]
MIGALAFTTPLLLFALVLLPILWWLLRAVPPAPIKRRFPGIVLLLGLRDDESETATTPWWLLLLRLVALAAVIVGFAGPVLNPRQAGTGTGPLLIVMDASWASARDWPDRMARTEELLRDAARQGRVAAVLPLTDPLPEEIPYQSANAWIERLPGLAPRAWAPSYEGLADLDTGGAEVIWFSDGLARPGRDVLTARVIEGERPILGLTPATYADGEITLRALRLGDEGARSHEISVIGPAPNGALAQLAMATVAFEPGAEEAEVALILPPELRNRVSRFEIAGIRSAGAVSLTDDSLSRRQVALLTDAGDEAQDLLSPLYYLRRALETTTDLIEGDLETILPASPDVLVFADVARLSPAEAEAVTEWVEEGGLLLRFAGPQLAASDIARDAEDPLMPVRLRSGGRTVGGALSWGEPKTLRPFGSDSPFFGLSVADEVNVTSQVMAQPDPTLAERSIAALADGTPLVTRKPLGQGQVVLFHVTANAEWSSLPLSGLFVQMLERLAVSTRPAAPSEEDLAGTTWVPRAVLDGFGTVRDAGIMPGVPGEALVEPIPSAELPPGLYQGPTSSLAVNVLGPDGELAPAAWPPGTTVETLARQPETNLMPWLLAAAMTLLTIDIVASLWLGGRLRRGVTAALFLASAAALAPSFPAQAQDNPVVPSEVSLAYVITGDIRLDETSEAGLRGLSEVLTRRTSVEPIAPTGVNLETDELAFLPLLYWPVTADQPLPSSDAYAKLNRYLRGGGMIVFDTRDANLGGFGSSSPASVRLRDLAAPLDIPPLEPLPADHVMTRSFYLIQDFPGRFASRDVWVEASPEVEQIEGMPFRNLNDGVTPVVIGANDWAAAWAIDSQGRALLPVGRGYAGEQQREIAYRWGVNLVMHVLSGNYKSDQVHVPALLDRLGN